MNPILQYLLVQRAKSKLKGRLDEKSITKKQIDSEVRTGQVEVVHTFREILFITIGILAASFGLRGFLLPNEFIDGGATGLSLLLRVFYDVPLGVFLITVNIPFIFLGARLIGRKFAIKSVCAIVVLAIVVHYLYFPTITNDKLLIAFFGGFFLGLGIGMTMRGGGVIDGTEILAIYLSRKWHMTVGDILLFINIIIFSVGAYLISVEVALYAILTYLIAAKTIDYVVDGVEEYTGVTIISEKSEEVRRMITEKMRRACTIYLGKGGYGENRSPVEIVFTVLTRLEIAKLSTELDKIDKKAFVMMSVVKDIKGGMIKRKPLK